MTRSVLKVVAEGPITQRMAAPHRIAIIEDDVDVRDLLEVIIGLDDRFELVGMATDGRAGVEMVHDLQPDAVILDLELPSMSGLDALANLARTMPCTRFAVFSAFPDPITLMDVLRLGADVYLDKGTAWSDLLPTLAALCADAPDALSA